MNGLTLMRLISIGSILLLALLLLPACGDGGGDSNTPPQCSPQYVYDNVSNQGESQVVADSEQDSNESSSAATITLTSEKSRKVTLSLSISLEGSLEVTIFKVILASIKASINASVSEELTATIGDQISITVPPLAEGYGNYGVYVQVASGHLYTSNCPDNQRDYGNVTSYTPEHEGWCTWIRGPDVFVEGDQSPCKTVPGS